MNSQRFRNGRQYIKRALLAMAGVLACSMTAAAQSQSADINPSTTSNGGGYLSGGYGEMYATIGEPFAADSMSVGIIDNGSTWTGFWQITPIGPIAAVREEFVAGSTVATAIMKIYPAPFSAMLTVDVAIGRPGKVDLAVYDLTGRRLGSLMGGAREPGTFHVAWRPEGIPSGNYVVRLVVDGVEHGAELVQYYR
jgi:hypothetical protein